MLGIYNHELVELIYFKMHSYINICFSLRTGWLFSAVSWEQSQ